MSWLFTKQLRPFVLLAAAASLVLNLALLVPALYMVAATTIALVLLFYRTDTSLPGLGIVLTGVPVYFLWRSRTGGVAAAAD